MAVNLGKKFEDRFKVCWEKSFPNSFIFRLNDQLSGFKNISKNPCDFICFTKGMLFLVECKTHKGASIPFTAIPQYESLLDYKGIVGVKPGVVIWFVDKDLVIWVSIEDMEKMVQSGEKSIGIRMLTDERYDIKIIPSKKLRTFLESDYSILV